MKQTSRILLMLLTLVSLSATTVPALELVSEVRVESTTGAPVKDGLTFSGLGFSDFVLKVFNGDVDSNRISSAVISLNGVKILSPADFNQTVSSLERSIVPLQGDNILSVSLRSNPGGFLKIQIFGEPTLNLPPDPGPAGDETIEGIDVNANGVRDDVERWIGLNYRDSEKTREALTQAYYPLQNFMIHARQGNRDAVYNDMTALGKASECLYYIRSEDANKLMADLESQVINTSDRVYAYRDSSRMLGGGNFPSSPISKWNQSCTFDPDSLPN
jgi:hypothetical protein